MNAHLQIFLDDDVFETQAHTGLETVLKHPGILTLGVNTFSFFFVYKNRFINIVKVFLFEMAI